jgi:hypothetical protein
MPEFDFAVHHIGTGTLPCFCCGFNRERELVQHELVAFVKKSESSDVFRFLTGKTEGSMFWPISVEVRQEDDWTQIAVGACDDHLPNLKEFARIVAYENNHKLDFWGPRHARDYRVIKCCVCDAEGATVFVTNRNESYAGAGLCPNCEKDTRRLRNQLEFLHRTCAMTADGINADILRVRSFPRTYAQANPKPPKNPHKIECVGVAEVDSQSSVGGFYCTKCGTKWMIRNKTAMLQIEKEECTGVMLKVLNG